MADCFGDQCYRLKDARERGDAWRDSERRAADRIAALEAALAEARDKLIKAAGSMHTCEELREHAARIDTLLGRKT